jgi:hypothetical protein
VASITVVTNIEKFVDTSGFFAGISRKYGHDGTFVVLEFIVTKWVQSKKSI